MTTKTQTILICDFCGAESPSVTTQRVTIDGVTAEAEVCSKDWTRLSKGFHPFTSKARKVPKRGRPARRTAPTSARVRKTAAAT